ncbi:MAG: hypothetical protein K9I68_09785 [Bacteroidales bacterium]|nr:hypothetical protein [Bacteroidales bacterium]MCF8338958.1 hypothetical protein [Bacteroidales bacterium]
MRHLIASFIFIIALAATTYGQNDYNQAIGVRGGLYNGVTYKKALSSNNYLEILGSIRWGGAVVTGLYEVTKNLDPDTPRLNWYYGFGAHIGLWSDYNDNAWFDEDADDFMAIGVDGIIGIEYTFEEVPINLSADWKPVINLIGADNAVGFFGAAASVRYVF